MPTVIVYNRISRHGVKCSVLNNGEGYISALIYCKNKLVVLTTEW